MKFCFDCKTEKPIEQFSANKRKADNRETYCKPCASKRSKDWRKKNPDYRKNENKEQKRNYLTKYKHGISREYLLEILKEQNGCKICGVELPENGGKWYVDHDHNCCEKNSSCEKCRRGILCRDCNLMLGFAKDNTDVLARAVEYLNEYTEKVNNGNTRRDGG